MKLPTILDGVPRIVLVLAVPVIAFVVTVGISLGTSGGNEENTGSVPSVAVQVTNRQPLAPQASPVTAQAQPQTATPVPPSSSDRTDCNAIRGTDYRSAGEREWFQKNCGAGSTANASTGTSSPAASSQAAARPPASTANSVSGGPSSTSGSSATAVNTAGAKPGVESPTGQRLVIPKAGVNADISITKMTGGQMPDPHGYFNALTYDMSDLGNFGGSVAGGNMVIAGHVDCGKCYNGGAGAAVFWSVRDLRAGDSAQVYTADGKVVNYVVTSSNAYSSGSVNWDSVASASSADMTIITCTGTFSSGEYDQRHVVQFRKA